MFRRFNIKKNLLGKPTVHYDCPECRCQLSSPLEDAGSTDTCPDCQATFIVPGSDKLKQYDEEQVARAELRREQKEIKRRQRELARERAHEDHQKAKAAAAEQKALAEKQERETREQSLKATKKCPFCSKEIVATAKKCKHCCELLDSQLREQQLSRLRQNSYPPLASGCFRSIAVSCVVIAAAVMIAQLFDSPRNHDSRRMKSNPDIVRNQTAAFQRAKDVISIFLKSGTKYDISKSHEYVNNNGGTTVKGSCSISGQTFLWTIAFDSAGGISAFNFDSVTFLARQPAGHLSYLPENDKYVVNEFVAMPSVEELQEAGIDVKVGF